MPKLRRMTHAFCRNCFQNLREYRQPRCDNCLVVLNESRVSIGHTEGLPLMEKTSCLVESLVERGRSCMSCFPK
ncbi:unnamed protein product [Sphacelaria rigidula]